jgi:hypothetical protein
MISGPSSPFDKTPQFNLGKDGTLLINGKRHQVDILCAKGKSMMTLSQLKTKLSQKGEAGQKKWDKIARFSNQLFENAAIKLEQRSLGSLSNTRIFKEGTYKDGQRFDNEALLGNLLEELMPLIHSVAKDVLADSAADSPFSGERRARKAEGRGDSFASVPPLPEARRPRKAEGEFDSSDSVPPFPEMRSLGGEEDDDGLTSVGSDRSYLDEGFGEDDWGEDDGLRSVGSDRSYLDEGFGEDDWGEDDGLKRSSSFPIPAGEEEGWEEESVSSERVGKKKA